VPRRSPLSRDRILEAALDLADAHGVEAITMRRLGDELGFEAMSLYRHVKNKDEVLDGILDLVLAETEPPALDAPWDVAIRRSALSVHEALERHPWATGLLMLPPRVRRRRVEYMDALLGCLRNAGFSPETTYTAYHVLDAHIYGFSLWLATYERAQLSPEQVAALIRSIPLEEYPHLLEHRDQHLTDGPHREVDAFEFGLDLVLGGLAKLRAGEPAASDPRLTGV
jgi:AcrR family transcriptional regulator